ncbi:MAG: hypothetical protein KTR24_17430 [Saprospiraceae bacterium]|nr:hypothetical protein [Saprospiraceae bacterium]
MAKKSKIHSTNYANVLIEVAEDCPIDFGQPPPEKGDKKTVANHQFSMLHDKPYAYTSDDVLFTVFARRKGFSEVDFVSERARFFSKGQPCFRASPLTKRYGWGVHSNADSKIALYAVDSKEYQDLLADPSVKKVKAMKSRR